MGTTDADLDAALAALQSQPPPVDTSSPSQADLLAASSDQAAGAPAGDAPPPMPASPPSAADMDAAATRMQLLDGTDTTTGAPTEVRRNVGLAATQQDRLTELRKYFPDAQPLPGGDNFVFTGPTGRQTYEPMGWRVPNAGDIESLIPEAAEGAGALAGGVAGTAVSPGVGTYAGAGLGAAAAREGVTRFLRYALGIPDTRTPGQQAADAAVTTGVNAVMPAVGDVGALGLRTLFAPGAETATSQAARALEASGAAPAGFARSLPPSVIGESPGTAKIESGVLSMPATGGLRQQFADAASGVDATAENLARRAASGPASGGAPGATPPLPDQFADTVGDIARQITGRWATAREAADGALQTAVGPNTMADLTPVNQFAAGLRAELAQAPQLGAARIQPTLDQIGMMTGDAGQYGGNSLPFQVVRKYRTDLGKLTDWQSSGAEADTPTANLQQLYGVLRGVIGDTAQAQGPAAEAALATHDGLVQAFNVQGGPKAALDMLANPATPANKIQSLMQSTRPQDTTAIGTLMSPNYAAPAEQAQIRAGVLARLGLNAQNEFSPGTWLANWNKMQLRNKQTMFGQADPDLLDSLNNLATVQDSARRSAAMKNFSNTAPVAAINGALTGLMAGFVSGSPKVMAISALSPFSSAPAGKLLSSAPFNRWMAGAHGINPAIAGRWGSYVGGLDAVAQADPSIRDELQQFRARLPDQLPASGGPQ